MAANVRIELDHDGIRELMCSAPIAAECEKAAQRVKQNAGQGFEVKQAGGGFVGNRSGYIVYADTYKAKLAEAENKVLSKAVR